MKNDDTSKKARGVNQSLNDDERAISKDFESKRSSRKQKFRGKQNGKGKNRKREKEVQSKYGNDPSWYAVSAQLLKDAASYSFNNPLGTPYGIGTNSSLVVPGIQAFYFIPTIGKSVDATSPVNVASRRIYTFVRHANSGRTNYDSPDLMLYLMAVDSAFMIYTHIARVIGIVGTYSQYNRYLPNAVIHALGVQPSTVVDNLADVRMKLNVLGAKLNSLAVPNTFAIYKRHSWLASNVYMDAPILKAQLYVTVPVGMYRYAEGPTTDQANKLSFVPIISPDPGIKTIMPVSIYNWLDALKVSTEALITSEDIGIMAGDILKAYGADKLIGVPMIPENYSVTPIYLQEFLIQINNMTLFQVKNPTDTQWENLDITQDVNTNAILCAPRLKATDNTNKLIQFNAFNDKLMVNLPMDFPTPEDVIVATRDMCSVDISNADVTTTPTVVTPKGYGSEIFTHCLIFHLSAGAPQGTYNPGTMTFSEINSTFLGRRAAFDWTSPLYSVDTSTGKILEIFTDIRNYTILTAQNLENMSETALLSMFDVPALNGFR